MSQPTYFVEHRRGEVTELQGLLRNPKLTADKRRGVIERVIAYMTLGIDVSKLFSDMIMATHTRDLVLKKMVYLYLATYAEQKPELALLAINTLQKDCRDDDPMVRGLALRSLCSLRIAKLVEYIIMPIRKGLNDPSPYVRKAAVCGCAKLFSISPDSVKDSDLVDILYNMLKDRDSNVVHNVTNALNDILREEGGMITNRPIIMHLLNRIRSFDEWAQCSVLELVAKYTPENDEEVFDIMNLLEDRLKHSNSAVVLGSAKVFLNFTKTMPQVHAEVYERIKAPLLTLIGGSSYHLSYPVLAHVRMLVARAPGVFDDQFKHFFIRYNDPVCVKSLKLEVLADIGNPSSCSDILGELSEYVTDVDVDIARTAIRTIGKLAIRIEESANEAVEHLLSFLDLNMDYVSTEACIVIKDILRKYPERYEEILPAIHKSLKTVDDEEGKVAVIWMIGEYGDVIDDAPYILENMIDNFEDEPSRLVRSELLSSTVKLFFKRPPEVQRMLGRLLSAAVSESSQVDVRDRALLYYRLLRYDVHEAARVVNCNKVVVDSFAESEDSANNERLFAEFNSLAVVYQKPSSEFVSAAVERSENDDVSLKDDRPDEVEEITPGLPGTASHSIPETGTMDLFSFGSEPSGASIELLSNATCDPAHFQSQWGSLGAGQSRTLALGQAWAQRSPDCNPVEHLLNQQHIFTIASGTVGNQMKMYYFAQTSVGTLCLMEVIIDLTQSTLSATFKAEQETAASGIADLFERSLQSLL